MTAAFLTEDPTDYQHQCQECKEYYRSVIKRHCGKTLCERCSKLHNEPSRAGGETGEVKPPVR